MSKTKKIGDINLSPISFFEKEYLNFSLGDDQKKAISSIIDWWRNSSDSVYCLYGSAGVGKTAVTKILTRMFEELSVDYILASPTHKAKKVLSTCTNREAMTLHKVLNLLPNINLLELDLSDLKFITKHRDIIPKAGLLIIDECSMINEYLYDYLLLKATSRNCKILAIGDSKQLSPVKEKNISKFFTVPNHYELTNIYRQSNDNPIMDYLSILRNTSVNKYKEYKTDNYELKIYSDYKLLLDNHLSLFQKVMTDKDPEYIKLLTYTNKRISIFNTVIRNRLFHNDCEYNVGEVLMGYDNCDVYGSDSGLINSEDYIVEKVEPCIKTINYISTVGYILTLKSSETFKVYVLSRNNPEHIFQALAEGIEALRLTAIRATSNKQLAWTKYFSLMRMFITPVDLITDDKIVRKKSIDYGYCISIHKSQGSSYQHVMLDMDNVYKYNYREELRQLQYVALSRTKQNIYMLWSKN